MSDPPAAPSKLTPVGILDRLLSFMDKPWKAVAIGVMLVIGGVGYLLYLERAEIANAILRGPTMTPKLSIKAFEMDVDQLLRETRADLAYLAELKIIDNTMIERSGYTRDGHPYVPTPGPSTALTAGTSMNLLVRFLRNEVVCFGIGPDSSQEEQRQLAKQGYVRECVVAVPPILGVQVGLLVVVWREALPIETEQRAASVAITTAAMKFATW